VKQPSITGLSSLHVRMERIKAVFPEIYRYHLKATAAKFDAQFDLSGTRSFGVWHTDISNGHISANRFNGEGWMAIGISGISPVTGWSVTANTGLANFSSWGGADIWLATATSQCIIGPGQGAAIADNGTDNAILTKPPVILLNSDYCYVPARQGIVP
jgi:hypothetical protein